MSKRKKSLRNLFSGSECTTTFPIYSTMLQTCHQTISPNIYINFQAQFYVCILSLLMLIGKILNLSLATLAFHEIFLFHLAFSLKKINTYVVYIRTLYYSVCFNLEIVFLMITRKKNLNIPH